MAVYQIALFTVYARVGLMSDFKSCAYNEMILKLIMGAQCCSLTTNCKSKHLLENNVRIIGRLGVSSMASWGVVCLASLTYNAETSSRWSIWLHLTFDIT